MRRIAHACAGWWILTGLTLIVHAVVGGYGHAWF